MACPERNALTSSGASSPGGTAGGITRSAARTDPLNASAHIMNVKALIIAILLCLQPLGFLTRDIAVGWRKTTQPFRRSGPSLHSESPIPKPWPPVAGFPGVCRVTGHAVERRAVFLPLWRSEAPGQA